MEQEGIELPPGLLQPFDMKALRDDLHVMAFVQGHPRWEAVEAMVRYRDGTAPLVRAILTGHDQSQVDHVNGPKSTPPDSAYRQRVHRAIAFAQGRTAQGPWVRVAFESVDAEAVVLELHAAGEPSVERGGFSDPGNHAHRSSLPLMWRGSSALAAERTEVTFDGRRHDLPVLVDRRPHFVGMHGFFTRQHWMGILRAGVTTQAGHDVQGWVETQRAGDRVTLVRPGDETQTVHAVRDAGRLRLCEFRVAAAGCDAGMSVAIAAGRFRCAIDGTLAVVEGRVECIAETHRAVIHLLPESPAWAARRVVQVTAVKRIDGWQTTTSIG